MSESSKILLAYILGAVIALVTSGFMHAHFESKSCEDLEKATGINLVYTYSLGCKRAEDM